MAMPQPGLNAQQTQNWANSFQQALRAGGQDPAMFGFSSKPAAPVGTPGQAQPIQPQSQGTPYGTPTKPPPAGMVYNKAPSGQAGNFSAYAPQQQQSNPFAQYNPQQMGNFAQQQMGLPSFQFTATDPFGNTFNNPAALTAQQGAMAQALNAQRAQQIQSGNIGPLNPMAAYQQAQNMVQGGWTNPFAAQPIQPPSQGTPYGQSLQASPARPGYTRTPDGRLLYSGPPEVGLQAPPRREGFERDAVGMPVLRAPQVWTNPSDPEWLKRELQSKPDTRPVVWDEANRRYIKNPYLAGGPARPDAAAPLQRYEPGFAYARR